MNTIGNFLPQSRTAVKRSDTTVTNSVALVNDTELLHLDLVHGKTYLFEAVLYHNASAAGDLKAGLNPPSGATIKWFDDAAPSTPLNAAGTVTVAGDGADAAARFHGVITMGDDNGSFGIAFAQAVADASDVVLQIGSSLWLRNID